MSAVAEIREKMVKTANAFDRVIEENNKKYEKTGQCLMKVAEVRSEEDFDECLEYWAGRGHVMVGYAALAGVKGVGILFAPVKAIANVL